MARVVDCADPVDLLPGMREARGAIARGDLVVMPTDTVYGIAADAFQPEAVQALLDAKGRGRSAPPPVLVPTRGTLDALAESVPPAVAALADAFWPGGLTLVVQARSTLAWDLGETNGTVGLRMPDDRIALELLAETGPLAVSSANRTGEPAATTVDEAREQLGDSVEVYLDAGATPGSTPSTIVDATGLIAGTGPLRVLRHGVIDQEALEAAAPGAFDEPADTDDRAAEDRATEDSATDERGDPTVPAEYGFLTATDEPTPEEALAEEPQSEEPQPLEPIAEEQPSTPGSPPSTTAPRARSVPAADGAASTAARGGAEHPDS